jgi:hypothetical protein
MKAKNWLAVIIIHFYYIIYDDSVKRKQRENYTEKDVNFRINFAKNNFELF